MIHEMVWQVAGRTAPPHECWEKCQSWMECLSQLWIAEELESSWGGVTFKQTQADNQYGRKPKFWRTCIEKGLNAQQIHCFFSPCHWSCQYSPPPLTASFASPTLAASNLPKHQVLQTTFPSPSCFLLVTHYVDELNFSTLLSFSYGLPISWISCRKGAEELGPIREYPFALENIGWTWEGHMEWPNPSENSEESY